MKRRYLLLGVSLAVCLTGCGVPGVPKPPSLELPQPVTDLRAVRKGNNVFLSWTLPSRTTDSMAIRHTGPTRVCRNTGAPPGAMCPNPVGTVLPTASPNQKPPNGQASYVDLLPQSVFSAGSLEPIFYVVSVDNPGGRNAGISNLVQVPGVVAPPPPADFRAQARADGILLEWTPAPGLPEVPGVSRLYRIYRREEGKDMDTVAGEVSPETSSLLDHTFVWEKTYQYRATVMNQIGSGKDMIQFEGEDSPAAKVFAHDVFPPDVPTGLQAVFSGVGQQPFIDLIWAPDTDADLAGYKVFRREEGGELTEISPQPVSSPAFRDTQVAAGRTYIYSISAVDVRGNESARSVEASERVP